MRRFWQLLSVLVLLLACTTYAQAAGKVALVIGIQHYDNEHYMDLPKALAGADLVADALKMQGFELIGGKAQHDLNFQDMAQRLQDLRVRAQTADLTVLYFAGHGVQFGFNNYLFPKDASVSSGAVPERTHSLNAWVDILKEENPSGARFIISDACRNNWQPQQKGTPPSYEGMQNTDAGTFVIYTSGYAKSVIDDNPVASLLASFIEDYPSIAIPRVVNELTKIVAIKTKKTVTLDMHGAFQKDICFGKCLTPTTKLATTFMPECLGKACLEQTTTITLSPVTINDFDMFVADMPRKTSAEKMRPSYCLLHDGSRWKTYSNMSWETSPSSNNAENPVQCISQKDAEAYAKWLTTHNADAAEYRLLTSIEWRYFLANQGAGADQALEQCLAFKNNRDQPCFSHPQFGLRLVREPST